MTPEDLRACLKEDYGLAAARIELLSLGHYANPGPYRIVTRDGLAYLAKVTSGAFYAAGCEVPRHLYDAGVTSVVAPIATQAQTLWAGIGEWTVSLYPYLEGDTGWQTMATEHWKTAGATFRRIHEVVPPTSGLADLRAESFDPSGYAESIRTNEARLERAEDARHATHSALRSSWVKHRSTIHSLLGSLDRLAAVLRIRQLPRVICHGDLHPGNLLRAPDGQVYVIDWDDVILAPRERDLIFVGEPAVAAANNDASPYFAEYGLFEVDWEALTYYRYERVVQDLIEDAEQVLFNDSLPANVKAEAVRMFAQCFTGRNLTAAHTAAAHIA